jgi:hypothetical protein
MTTTCGHRRCESEGFPNDDAFCGKCDGYYSCRCPKPFTRTRKVAREIVHCFPACIIVHLFMEVLL